MFVKPKFKRLREFLEKELTPEDIDNSINRVHKRLCIYMIQDEHRNTDDEIINDLYFIDRLRELMMSDIKEALDKKFNKMIDKSAQN
jgi:hypothetical protein